MDTGQCQHILEALASARFASHVMNPIPILFLVFRLIHDSVIQDIKRSRDSDTDSKTVVT